ncbi:MAG: polyphosphate kinase 2 family protein [Chthoniobacterales bacterium]
MKSLISPYQISSGKKFLLKSCDPSDTGDFKDKEHAKDRLAAGVARIAELQEKLYAQDQWSLLLVFQAMDAAGKDSVIKHVMSGTNPQACQVYSFKQPSSEDLDHDFLWRCQKCLPERGRIGIFNRSYYEETLVVRVHPEFLAKQKLPRQLVGKDIWENRFQDINDFERTQTRNGTIIRKFFLNVSKEEQKKRFLARLDDPTKNWKFSAADVAERGHWDEYMAAYEDMIRHTATESAPWFVVPADKKWFTRLVVVAAVIDALESLDLEYPSVTEAMKKDNLAARKILASEK